MADTPQQAEARRQLAARGNKLAPRVDSSGNASSGTVARSARPGRATQRRAVVKGAVTGAKTGPTGAARGAANSARKSRSSRVTRSAGNRSGKFAMGKLESPASGALFAEYFAGAFVISIGLFTKSSTDGYLPTMSKIMTRLTALTAVFFVLFLMTGSKRGGQAAMWFGLLIDLGIVFTAAKGETFTTLADMISGKGSGIQLTSATGAATVSTDTTSGLVAPHPEPAKLPDE